MEVAGDGLEMGGKVWLLGEALEIAAAAEDAPLAAHQHSPHPSVARQLAERPLQLLGETKVDRVGGLGPGQGQLGQPGIDVEAQRGKGHGAGKVRRRAACPSCRSSSPWARWQPWRCLA